MGILNPGRAIAAAFAFAFATGVTHAASSSVSVSGLEIALYSLDGVDPDVTPGYTFSDAIVYLGDQVAYSEADWIFQATQSFSTAAGDAQGSVDQQYDPPWFGGSMSLAASTTGGLTAKSLADTIAILNPTGSVFIHLTGQLTVSNDGLGTAGGGAQICLDHCVTYQTFEQGTHIYDFDLSTSIIPENGGLFQLSAWASAAPIPEPRSAMLMCAGIACLAATARWLRRA